MVRKERRPFSFTLESEINLFREVSLMFDLVTAHDFYAMLVEDFDDFMAEPHSARRAVHCAITAHHLLDWVWHDQIASHEELRTQFAVQSLKEFAFSFDSRSLLMPFIHPIATAAN